MLTVPQLVLPIVVGMILLGWEQPQLRRPAAVVSLSVIIAALTGIALYFGVGRTGIINHGDIPHWVTSVHAAARTFVRTFWVLTSSLGIVYVGCVILGLAVGIFIAVQAIFFRQVSKDLAVILVASSALAGLVAPILTGVYSEVALFRYQLPFYTLPIIILVWLLCRLLPGRYWISMSAAAALSVVTVVKNANPAWQRPRVLNPSFVEVTDALQRLPADLTLAEYWSAKPIYIGSSRELMVCPIAADGSIFIWIANYGWCTEGLARWARHHNWLAVDVNDRVDRTAIVTIYGRPDREIVLQNHQLWLYSWSIERQSNLWRVICRPVTPFTRTPPCF
jgi:hypothetical protein